MYDDFWAGYNYGNPQPKFTTEQMTQIKQEIYSNAQEKERQQRVPGVYNKSKFIRMRGPAGEVGEIYANGKMYIMAGGGKAQVRTFPSRPYAIKYMQTKGWVLI